MSDPVIEIKNLSVSYETENSTYEALKEINLTINRCQFICIVGSSGCGKSTLLSVLAGLQPVTSGSVTINGKEIHGPGAERAVVFQSYSLFPWMTALENVSFAVYETNKKRGTKLSKKEAAEIAKTYLKRVELSSFENQLPGELSGGMQQRVAIARAMACDPEILLMDEPFGALDAKIRENLQGLILKMWGEDEKKKTDIKSIKNKLKLTEDDSSESEDPKEDDDEDELRDLIESSLPPFDINLLEYSKTIQGYMKERNRILHDKNYRRFAITRNDALSKAKTDEEKIEVYKKLNDEYNSRGKEIDPSIEVKICDIGNACWFNHHFSTIIQTRQYRSPEVLIGVNYNETSDIWSLACIVFELVTGDFLFQPEKGETFTKNDDHVAKFIQTLGKMPKNFAKRGEYYNKFFTKEGKMRRVKEIKHVGIKEILVKKYHFKETEAQALTDFLLPMLEFYPERRASARELLRHPWLTMPPNYDYLMNETEIFRMNMKENLLGISEYTKDKKDENDNRDVYSSDSELNEADCEDNDKLVKIQEDNDDDDDIQLGDTNPDKINIPNYNNSFCMYGQFVDLTSLDQPNPQFDKIIDQDLL